MSGKRCEGLTVSHKCFKSRGQPDRQTQCLRGQIPARISASNYCGLLRNLTPLLINSAVFHVPSLFKGKVRMGLR